VRDTSLWTASYLVFKEILFFFEIGIFYFLLKLSDLTFLPSMFPFHIPLPPFPPNHVVTDETFGYFVFFAI